MAGIAGLTLVFIILGIGLFFLALPLFAIIDIVRSEFEDHTNKLIWVIIVIFFPIIGSLLYFTIGKGQKRR
jgi:hypothetical protein